MNLVSSKDYDLRAEEFLRIQVQMDPADFDDPAAEYEVHATFSFDNGTTFVMETITYLHGSARAKDGSMPFIEYPPGGGFWIDPDYEYHKFDFAHVDIFSNKPAPGGII